MNATDIMTEQVYYVSPSESVARVKNLFLKHKISSVLVMDGDRPVGFVGEPDVADAFYQAHEPVDEVRVDRVMKKKVTQVGPQATPEDVARALLKDGSKAAIVFEEEVMGIITKTDLLDYFVKNRAGQAKVKEVMDTNIRTVKPTHSLFHAIRLMQEQDIGRVLVFDSGLKGIVSLKDVTFVTPKARPTRLIFKKPFLKGKEREVKIMPFTVEEVMKTDVQTISPEADASKAAKMMLDKGIGSLVVLDAKGIVQGIITKTDFARYLSR